MSQSGGFGDYMDLLHSLRHIESKGAMKQAKQDTIVKSAGNIITSSTMPLPSKAALSSSSDGGKKSSSSKLTFPSGPGNDEFASNNPVAYRLGALTMHTASAASAIPRVDDPKLAAALIEEIVQGSKLLNKTNHLPPHLATFKLDFEKFQEKKIRLPTLHQQVTPRTKKRIAQLPPSSADEVAAVEKFVMMAKSVSGASAYQNLSAAVTKSRINAQLSHQPEKHVAQALSEAELKSKFERVLMPKVALGDLGLSQKDMTDHSSEEFFARAAEHRKQDAIKASIAARWAPGADEDNADAISLLDAGPSSLFESSTSTIAGGSKYPFESPLTSFLNDKTSKNARSPSPPTCDVPSLPLAGSPLDSAISSSKKFSKSLANRELYGTIAERNERGRPIYDKHGNLHPDTLNASYTEVFEKASDVHSAIDSRYKELQRALKAVQADKASFKRAEKTLLNEIKTRCYDDMGLDLDTQFTAVRIASKAVNMMMFYMVEVRLRGSFMKLKEQTRLASIARREKAAAVINRVARGMLVRAETRQVRRMIFLARELERRTTESRSSTLKKAAERITRSLRMYGKMRVLRRKRLHRLAATCIQRHIRGKLARIRVHRLRNWNDWLRHNAVKIQCAVRQRVARRRTCVLRKIGIVKVWEHQAEALRKAKALELRRIGAAAFIIHCYRAYRVRVKLRIIIYWHRVELAVVLQKWVRGYFDRKLVKRMKKRKFDREKVVREAAVSIQKWVRGKRDRKIYKKLLAVKVAALLAKRRAKTQYLKEAAKNNAVRILYGTLRTFVPFRYVILRSKARLIQKVYRGYRARKRVFYMKIHAAISKMNKKYFGGYHGALQFQRIYRGYRYRRERLKAKRRAAALVIQCAFRCSQARWRIVQKKISRDAMMLIGRNIAALIKFKKAERIRRENRKYRHVAVKIQSFARKCLSRMRCERIRTGQRSQKERDDVNNLRLNHILASVQLRMLMESMRRPLGAKSDSACGEPCYALGPVQAIFCAAVGKKAQLQPALLQTNKVESGALLKFASRVKGFLEKGRQEEDSVDDLYKHPQFLAEDANNKKPQPKAQGQGSRLAQGKGAVRGPGRGTRQRVDKVKMRRSPPGRFALIDALRSGGIAVMKGVKVLSKLDLEMLFAKVKQEGQSGLKFTDFVALLDFAAKIHYAVPEDDDQSITSEAALRAYESKFNPEGSEHIEFASIGINENDDADSLGSVDPSTQGEEVESLGGESAISAATERAMKEKRREARLKKRGVKVGKAKAAVDDGQLLWPLREITSRSQPNHQMLLLLKMIDSWRSQEWWLDLADWMEQEARARVAIYVKRMQNLYWHMKSAGFRAIMRDRLGAKAKLEEYNQTVVVIQSWVRRFICKARVQHKAQVFLVKYIPDVGEGYWYNPSTRVTSRSKPLILGPYDCLSIAMPPPGLEYVVQCSNCTTTAVLNCWDCEDSYCRKCYDNLHCKGKRRFHHYFPIPMCGYCKFQMASKCCITCITIKPEPGSAQEQMKESDRGTLCDCCFAHLHDENERHFAEEDLLKRDKQRQIFARSHEAYLVKHQLKERVVTDHKYDSTVQTCEECDSRAASWRCNNCKQIYCNKCLVGLHSMGGAFAAHKAERLPYYTMEMHQSYLRDQRTQIFQNKMQVVMRIWGQRAEAHRYRSIVKLQAWWRMVFHGRKGKLRILRGRKRMRRQWRLRQAEQPIRSSIKYKLLDLLGMAPSLLSDTREEQVLKGLTVFGKQFAREYIWKNMDSFGFYKSAGPMYKKGDPKRGFEVGEIEELKRQARQGGFRMPGRVMLKKGQSKHTTTHDLRELLKNGMLVRIVGAYFAVRHVSESSLRLDRIWRWADAPDGEICYRLPAYQDEPRRNQYKAMYHIANFAISNPISQSYFSSHYKMFDNLKGVAEYIENVYKRWGFRKGSMEWRRYAKKMERRAKWAQDLLNDNGEVVDLSKQKSVKEKKPGTDGGGGAVAAALQAAVEAGEVKLPEEDSDEEVEVPMERAYGERWEANEEELAVRLAAEAAMSEDQLIATCDQWEEAIDPMSENIFWTNKLTFEMVADMPAALKTKIAKAEKTAADKKNVDDARAKLNAAKGVNAFGKKKTAVGMSGKR